MEDSGLTLSLFIESWELFKPAVIAGTAMGALLGWMGVYIVLRRMVFLSAALSQCAGLGVTLAFYAQIHLGVTGIFGSPALGAAVATFAAALLPMLDRSALGARRDAFIGFAFLIGAGGALGVGTRIVQEVHDVHTILFGSAVAVLDEDLTVVLATAGALLTLQALGMRGFIQASFDRDSARVRGLPVRTLDFLLLSSLALGISVGTQVLGALPIFAFSVLPAMAVLPLAPSLPIALVAASVIGAIAGSGGYVIAFLYQLPVGASQTLVAASLVLATLTLKAIVQGLRRLVL